MPTPPQHPISIQSTLSEQFESKHNLVTLRDTNAPEIKKYNGTTNITQFLEDFEARFILRPLTHPTNRHKVIVTAEHLVGAINEQAADCPKNGHVQLFVNSLC